MLLVKQFLEEVYKLRGFFTQIKIKIVNKGTELPIVIKQVAYTGLFLLGKVLKWFKSYLIEIQKNGLTTTNLKVRYIFLIQEGFYKYIIQIFKSLEKKLIAKKKLKIL